MRRFNKTLAVTGLGLSLVSPICFTNHPLADEVKVPLSVEQHFSECALGIAMGYWDCAVRLVSQLQGGSHEFDELTRVALLVLVKDARVDEVVRAENDSGRWTMRVKVSFRIQGMGGRVRAEGFLNVGGDKPWVYRHKRFADNMDSTLADVMQSLLQVGERLVIYEDGWKLDPAPDSPAPPRPPSVAPKTPPAEAKPAASNDSDESVQFHDLPATQANTESAYYAFREPRARFRLCGATWSPNDTSWSALLDAMRSASLDLLLDDEERRTVRLAPGEVLFLRTEVPDANQYALVVVRRDSHGRFRWTTQSSDQDWVGLGPSSSHTVTTTFPGGIKWEVTISRPSLAQDPSQSQVRYQSRVFRVR